MLRHPIVSWRLQKKLYISQPAISKWIKTLEDELHTNLFYRGNKGIRLTPEGEKYLKYVIEANELLLAGKRILTDENELNNGLMIIGAQSHIVRYYLLEKIAKFKEKYPNVKIRVIDLSTHELLDALEKHSIDLVIDSSPIDVIYNNITIKKIASLDTCFIKLSKIVDTYLIDDYIICEDGSIVYKKEKQKYIVINNYINKNVNKMIKKYTMIFDKNNSYTFNENRKTSSTIKLLNNNQIDYLVQYLRDIVDLKEFNIEKNILKY